uniref:Succinate dehydrogenase assembly factor 4, mitochondrial n=2 Tax=Tetraselmis sp. GSL018 TaxID=582737 RepID=A0A061RHF7_9CHLO|mmetsp:Transcript_28045/g.66609  ORF Transcript_28045/g.66609 Transcript_28045/m.66609 type:complete len:104 (+) Transcript_28045:189-500(+)
MIIGSRNCGRLLRSCYSSRAYAQTTETGTPELLSKLERKAVQELKHLVDKRLPPEQTDAEFGASVTEKVSDDARERTREIGGPTGKEPTRFGDWEKNGRCSDF